MLTISNVNDFFPLWHNDNRYIIFFHFVCVCLCHCLKTKGDSQKAICAIPLSNRFDILKKYIIYNAAEL